LKLNESIVCAKVFESLGVDLLNVSIGITPTSLGGSRTKKRMGFVPLAREIKKNVSVPVATVGKITTKEDAQMIVDRCKADLVCVCRCLLADPKWPAKVQSHDETQITACKSCKVCVHYSTGCPK
jgi:2,4-dienoyl-CoA reductase-like NADH-dependent reductase (Old Yellow Enzyme family)